MQNKLLKNLPPAVLAGIPDGRELSYAIIPKIQDMPQPLKLQVQIAFASSLRAFWIAMTVICGVGFISSMAIRNVPLRRAVDKKWGMAERPKSDKLNTAA
jgi:hypothetical protein